MNMKKLVALLLAICMIAALAVGCAKKDEDKKGDKPTTATGDATDPTEPEEVVTVADSLDPSKYADIEDHFERSQAIYADVLGEFNYYYEKAKDADNTVSERYALMAVAEAKMLSAGIFLPTTSQGGNYAMTKVAPYTNTPVLFGNDTYRFHDRIVTTDPIKASDIAAMKAKWAECKDSAEYEAFVKSYLAEQGYTIKDTATFYFDANPESWDVLATSMAADSEILVNTYDGLIEYDMKKNYNGALAESWTVSDDGTVYTFNIRKGIKWVDSQGREVAEVKADDFVAGLQHMMDAMGGLEYLIEGIILNASEYMAGDVDFEEVGVKAIDDYTLEYTLCGNTPFFMTMLGYGVFAPLSRSYYVSMGGAFGEDYAPDAETYKYAKGPDSIAYCGPYRITSFNANNSINFATNEAYWDVKGNNLKEMTFMYTDGSDPVKPYNDFFNGVADTMGMTTERVEIAKEKGTYDEYAYVSETDATSYCGFLNVYRVMFNNYTNDAIGVSPKTDAEKTAAQAAMLNKHFRLALVMAIDRGTYNAQSVGEDLKYNALINSYTPGTFVQLAEDVTIKINGTDTTFKAGTQYGEIMQAQLDADGISLKVWDGQASSGFDGWYNPEAAKAELTKAVEQLKELGVEVTAENPICIDLPVRTDSATNMNMKQAVKQSVEEVTEGLIKVNLVEYATRDDYLDATYWYDTGDSANFDFNDGSGWGPDYGDPQTYLDTMLGDGAGYMTKSIGLF